MPRVKKKGHLGHNMSRQNLCVVCLKKSKRKLTKSLVCSLKEFTSIFKDISYDDKRVPTGICDLCYVILKSKLKGKAQNSEFKIPENFHFTDVIISKDSENKQCNCLLCELASVKGKSKTSLIESTKSLKIDEKSKSIPEKRLCPSCFSVLAKGFSHVCNDTTALDNLITLKEKKPVLAEAFAAYIIKNTESSPNGTRRLSQLRGKKLPVTIGQSDIPSEPIPLHKFAQFAYENHLSQNQARAFGTFLGELDIKIEITVSRRSQ